MSQGLPVFIDEPLHSPARRSYPIAPYHERPRVALKRFRQYHTLQETEAIHRDHIIPLLEVLDQHSLQLAQQYHLPVDYTAKILWAWMAPP